MYAEANDSDVDSDQTQSDYEKANDPRAHLTASAFAHLDRKIIVDSDASYHLISRKYMSDAEKAAIRRAREP